MVGAMLPLELGGRRAARIAVAQRELELREHELANRERLLAAEVRLKFGETLAQALNSHSPKTCWQVISVVTT